MREELIVNECPKQHCPHGEATEDNHTIQDVESGLEISMDIWSTLLYFVTQKPNDNDLDEGVPVLFTPEGVE